ncbi:putative reverse transcriptase domain-containing protein [Tanacetum coccineum]
MLRGLDEQIECRSDRVLYYMDRIWVPLTGDVRTLIMDEAHKSRYSVHPGADKMYYDLRDMYWCPGMKKDIALYVSKCLTCSKVKAEHERPSGLLHQLEIPEWKWERIAMDFITKLPRTSSGHDSIWVIMDKFTKSAHFLSDKDRSKVEKDSSKPSKRETSKIVEEEKVEEEDVNREPVLIEKKVVGIKRKTLTRRRASDKQVVPDEEEFVDPEILHTKFPIVDWESQSLYSMRVYKIIRADGNTSYHKTFERIKENLDYLKATLNKDTKQETNLSVKKDSRDRRKRKKQQIMRKKKMILMWVGIVPYEEEFVDP